MESVFKMLSAEPSTADGEALDPKLDPSSAADKFARLESVELLTIVSDLDVFQPSISTKLRRVVYQLLNSTPPGVLVLRTAFRWNVDCCSPGCRRCSEAETLSVATRRCRGAIHIVPFRKKITPKKAISSNDARDAQSCADLTNGYY
ncbi:hypothetical protein M513_13412 [Trichuris suis]|uniref:Uncharacterized protein n=1 Tax=Trichuris suis TaxID=68888 RepID=A0A085LL61_9BILA|nr:hypothetical protein M513_13412 [Trichuris suis]